MNNLSKIKKDTLNLLLSNGLSVVGYVEGEYFNINSNCIVECKIHGKGCNWGNPWNPSYKALRTSINKCPKCNNKYKRTTLEALQYLRTSTEEKLTPLSFIGGKYINNTTRCVVECSIHGKGCDWKNPWNPSFSNLVRYVGCPKCSGKYIRTQDEQLILLNEISPKVVDVLDFKGDYKGRRSKCIINCKIHGDATKWGNPYYPTVNELMEDGSGCSKCTNRYVKAEAEVREEILNLETNYYSFNGFVDDLYLDNKTRCNVECKIHGTGESRDWFPRVCDIIKNSFCNLCSREEYAIKSYVNRKNKSIETSKSVYFITFKILKTNEIFYKIGVHKNGIKNRFTKSSLRKDGVDILNSQEIKMETLDALVAEYWVINYFANYKDVKSDILKVSKGGTECFNFDLTKILTLGEMVQTSKEYKEKIINKVCG
jgi:hypothetical protein